MIPRSGNFLVDAQDDWEDSHREKQLDCGCDGERCVCDSDEEELNVIEL